YRIRVNTSVKDQNSNALQEEYTFTGFTTRETKTTETDTSSDTTTTSSTDSETIYIVGSVTVKESGKYVGKPVIWKNYKMEFLADKGYTESLVIKNNDIYISGSYGSKPVYWENGVINQVNVPKGFYKNGTSVKGIAVSEDRDVYLAGLVAKSAGKSMLGTKQYKYYPSYWKNGSFVKRLLTNKEGDANKIGVDPNGDIYITGWRFNNHHSYVTLYWKNGQEVILNTSNDGATTDVDISGSGVYISGWHGNLDVKRNSKAFYKKVGAKSWVKIPVVSTKG
ncbi:uncharacterized protein METZ01_LOCUS408922, partial [marine metagenome]